MDTLPDYSKFYRIIIDNDGFLDSTNFLKIQWGGDFHDAYLFLDKKVDCFDSYFKKMTLKNHIMSINMNTYQRIA